MPLGIEVGLSTGGVVLDGDSATHSPKREQGFQFSAHFYCGQTAGCIKMPLGMEICVGPGHIVLDAGSTERGTAPPIFGPCIRIPLGRNSYGGRPQPR